MLDQLLPISSPEGIEYAESLLKFWGIMSASWSLLGSASLLAALWAGTRDEVIIRLGLTIPGYVSTLIWLFQQYI